MRINRGWFLAIAVLLLPLFLLVVAKARGDRDETKFRWDIISLSLPGVTVNAGGTASALATDGSMITVTGSGTLQPGDNDEVSGGGNWTTFDSTGHQTGTGSYKVKRLVKFDLAPGTQRSTIIDKIGDGTLADNRSVLAVFLIRYSDRSSGLLFVSCGLSGGPGPAAPATVFEGITATKGFVDYFNRVPPSGSPSTANANRTLFHILPEEED